MFKTNNIQLNQDPSFQRKSTLNELQMFNIILSIHTVSLLIPTLQCEQKHIIHESLLQTFNSPVNQLLLCPE